MVLGLSYALFVTMVAHAIGLFMGDFVPFFHFLNVVSLRLYASLDPVFAFVFVFLLSADRTGPRQCGDSHCASESGGGKKSNRDLAHDCVLLELAGDRP